MGIRCPGKASANGDCGDFHFIWWTFFSIPFDAFLSVGHSLPKRKVAVRAKLLQLCPSFCNPVDSSPPGFSVHGILLPRILKWVAMPSSRGSSPRRDGTCTSLRSPALPGRFFTTSAPGRPKRKLQFSSVSQSWLFATSWNVARQASLSMEFSRQEYWSGLPLPSGDLPDPGIEPGSPAL